MATQQLQVFNLLLRRQIHAHTITSAAAALCSTQNCRLHTDTLLVPYTATP